MAVTLELLIQLSKDGGVELKSKSELRKYHLPNLSAFVSRHIITLRIAKLFFGRLRLELHCSSCVWHVHAMFVLLVVLVGRGISLSRPHFLLRGRCRLLTKIAPRRGA